MSHSTIPKMDPSVTPDRTCCSVRYDLVKIEKKTSVYEYFITYTIVNLSGSVRVLKTYLESGKNLE